MSPAGVRERISGQCRPVPQRLLRFAVPSADVLDALAREAPPPGVRFARDQCFSFDDVYYDTGRKRIYVPGGEGFISVIQQTDADHYQALAKIPSTIGARTGLWYEKRDRFYLAVPASSKEGAALWVYAPED